MEAIRGRRFLTATLMKWKGFSSGVRPTLFSRVTAWCPSSAQPRAVEEKIAREPQNSLAACLILMVALLSSRPTPLLIRSHSISLPAMAGWCSCGTPAAGTLISPPKPLAKAGCDSRAYQPSLRTNAAANKKSIYLLTTDGRLAQVWDTDRWHLDFPAEAAGQGGLRFQNGVAVFATNASANKKSIYAITTDGRLAQVWDTGRWNLDFPAEAAGQGGLRFQGIPAVFRRPTPLLTRSRSTSSQPTAG